MLTWKPRLKIFQSSTRTNIFNPELFEGRSYNHWLYVMKKGKHIIFNDYNYSSTTNKHQYEMRRFLITKLNINYDKIIFVDQYESLDRGIFLDSFYERKALAEVKLKIKGQKKSFYDDQKDVIKRMNEKIKLLRTLGAKFSHNLTYYRILVKEQEENRLTRQREKSKLQREKRKALLTAYKSQYESTTAISV